MMDWRLFELECQVRQAELQQRRTRPLPPAKPPLSATLRQGLARGLVSLGVRIDAEASRAAVGAPRLNGSDV